MSKEVVLICLRVSDDALKVTVDSQILKCDLCGEKVSVALTSLPFISDLGAVVRCWECAPADYAMQAPTDAQRAELKAEGFTDRDVDRAWDGVKTLYTKRPAT